MSTNRNVALLRYDVEILASHNLACKDPKIKCFYPSDAAEPCFQTTVKKNSPSAVWTGEKFVLEIQPPLPQIAAQQPAPAALDVTIAEQGKGRDHDDDDDGQRGMSDDDRYILRVGAFDCRGGQDVFVGNMFVDVRTGTQVGDGAPLQRSLSGGVADAGGSGGFAEATHSVVSQRKVTELKLLAGTLQMAQTLLPTPAAAGGAIPSSEAAESSVPAAVASLPARASANLVKPPSMSAIAIATPSPLAGVRSSVNPSSSTTAPALNGNNSFAAPSSAGVVAVDGAMPLSSPTALQHQAAGVQHLQSPTTRIVVTLRRIVMMQLVATATTGSNAGATLSEVIARVVYPTAPSDGNDVLCAVNEPINFSVSLAPLGSNTTCTVTLWVPSLNSKRRQSALDSAGGALSLPAQPPSAGNGNNSFSGLGSAAQVGPLASFPLDLTRPGIFTLHDDSGLDPVTIEVLVEHMTSAATTRQSVTMLTANSSTKDDAAVRRSRASVAPPAPAPAPAPLPAQLCLLVESLEVHRKVGTGSNGEPQPPNSVTATTGDDDDDTSVSYALQWRVVVSSPELRKTFTTSTKCPMVESSNRRAYLCAHVNEMFTCDVSPNPAQVGSDGVVTVTVRVEKRKAKKRRPAGDAGGDDEQPAWVEMFASLAPLKLDLKQQLFIPAAATGDDTPAQPVRLEAVLAPSGGRGLTPLQPVSNLAQPQPDQPPPGDTTKSSGQEGRLGTSAGSNSADAATVDLQFGLTLPQQQQHAAALHAIVPVPMNDRSRSLCPSSTRVARSGQQCSVQLCVKQCVLHTTTAADWLFQQGKSGVKALFSACAVSITGSTLRGMQTAESPHIFVADFNHSFVFTVTNATRIVMLNLLGRISPNGDGEAAPAGSSPKAAVDTRLCFELIAQAEFCAFDHVDSGKCFFPLFRKGESIGVLLLEWTSNFYTPLPQQQFSRTLSLRPWTRAELTVVAAKELVVADLGGVCNAYVIVQRLPLDPNFSNLRFITPTVKASKNPDWSTCGSNSVAYAVVANETQGFVFLVLDDDALGSDNFLGMCVLQSDAPHWCEPEGDMWLPLQPKEALLEKLSGGGSVDHLDRSGFGSLRVQWKFTLDDDESLSSAAGVNKQLRAVGSNGDAGAEDIIASGGLSVVFAECVVKHLPPLSALVLEGTRCLPVSLLAPPVFYLQILLGSEVVSELRQLIGDGDPPQQIPSKGSNALRNNSPNSGAATASIAVARQFIASFAGELVLRGSAIAKYISLVAHPEAQTSAAGNNKSSSPPSCCLRVGFRHPADPTTFVTVCSKQLSLSRKGLFTASPSGLSLGEALELEPNLPNNDRLGISPSLLTFSRRVVEEATTGVRWRSPLSSAPKISMTIRQLRSMIATASTSTSLQGVVTIVAELLSGVSSAGLTTNRQDRGPASSPGSLSMTVPYRDGHPSSLLSGGTGGGCVLIGRRDIVVRPGNSDPTLDWTITLPIIQDGLEEGARQRVLGSPQLTLPVIRFGLTLRSSGSGVGIANAVAAKGTPQPEVDIGSCIIDTSFLLSKRGSQWFTVATPTAVSCVMHCSYEHNFLAFRSPTSQPQPSSARTIGSNNSSRPPRTSNAQPLSATGGGGLDSSLKLRRKTVNSGTAGEEEDDEDVVQDWTMSEVNTSSMMKSLSSNAFGMSEVPQLPSPPELTIEVCQARNIVPSGGAVISCSVIVGLASETLSTSFAPPSRHPVFNEGASFRLQLADQLPGSVARIQLVELSTLQSVASATVPVHRFLREQITSVWVPLVEERQVAGPNQSKGQTSTGYVVGEVLICSRVTNFVPFATTSSPETVAGPSVLSPFTPQKLRLRLLEATKLIDLISDDGNTSRARNPVSAYVAVYAPLGPSGSPPVLLGETSPVPQSFNPVWAQDIYVEVLPSLPVSLFVYDSSSAAANDATTSPFLGSCVITPQQLQEALLAGSSSNAPKPLDLALVNCDENGVPRADLGKSVACRLAQGSKDQLPLGLLRVAVTFAGTGADAIAAAAIDIEFQRQQQRLLSSPKASFVTALIQPAMLRLYSSSPIQQQQQVDGGSTSPRRGASYRIVLSVCENLRLERKSYNFTVAMPLQNNPITTKGGTLTGITPTSMTTVACVPSLISVQLFVDHATQVTSPSSSTTGFRNFNSSHQRPIAVGSFSVMAPQTTSTVEQETTSEYWVDLHQCGDASELEGESGICGRLFVTMATVAVRDVPVATPTTTAGAGKTTAGLVPQLWGGRGAAQSSPSAGIPPASPARTDQLDLQVDLLELTGLLSSGGMNSSGEGAKLRIGAVLLPPSSSSKSRWSHTTKSFVLPQAATSSDQSLELRGLHDSFKFVIPNRILAASTTSTSALNVTVLFRLVLELHHHHRAGTLAEGSDNRASSLIAEGILKLTASPSAAGTTNAAVEKVTTGWLALQEPSQHLQHQPGDHKHQPKQAPTAYLRLSHEWVPRSPAADAEQGPAVMIYRVEASQPRPPIVAPVLRLSIATSLPANTRTVDLPLIPAGAKTKEEKRIPPERFWSFQELPRISRDERFVGMELLSIPGPSCSLLLGRAGADDLNVMNAGAAALDEGVIHGGGVRKTPFLDGNIPSGYSVILAKSIFNPPSGQQRAHSTKRPREEQNMVLSVTIHRGELQNLQPAEGRSPSPAFVVRGSIAFESAARRPSSAVTVPGVTNLLSTRAARGEEKGSTTTSVHWPTNNPISTLQAKVVVTPRDFMSAVEGGFAVVSLFVDYEMTDRKGGSSEATGVIIGTAKLPLGAYLAASPSGLYTAPVFPAAALPAAPHPIGNIEFACTIGSTSAPPTTDGGVPDRSELLLRSLRRRKQPAAAAEFPPEVTMKFSLALLEVHNLPGLPAPPSSKTASPGTNRGTKTRQQQERKDAPSHVKGGPILAQLHIPSIQVPILMQSSHNHHHHSSSALVEFDEASTKQLEQTLVSADDLLDRKFAASFWARVSPSRVMFRAVTTGAGRVILQALAKAAADDGSVVSSIDVRLPLLTRRASSPKTQHAEVTSSGGAFAILRVTPITLQGKPSEQEAYVTLCLKAIRWSNENRPQPHAHRVMRICIEAADDHDASDVIEYPLRGEEVDPAHQQQLSLQTRGPFHWVTQSEGKSGKELRIAGQVLEQAGDGTLRIIAAADPQSLVAGASSQEADKTSSALGDFVLNFTSSPPAGAVQMSTPLIVAAVEWSFILQISMWASHQRGGRYVNGRTAGGLDTTGRNSQEPSLLRKVVEQSSTVETHSQVKAASDADSIHREPWPLLVGDKQLSSTQCASFAIHDDHATTGHTTTMIETGDAVELVSVGGVEQLRSEFPQDDGSGGDVGFDVFGPTRLLHVGHLKWRQLSGPITAPGQKLPPNALCREGHAACAVPSRGLLVMDGGFGPGGLDVSLAGVAGTYEDLRHVYCIGSANGIRGGTSNNNTSLHGLSSILPMPTGACATPARSTATTSASDPHQQSAAATARRSGSKRAPPSLTAPSLSSAPPPSRASGGGASLPQQGYLDSTLLFDVQTKTWTKAPTVGAAKDFRCDHSLVYSERDSLVVAFGGWAVRVEEHITTTSSADTGDDDIACWQQKDGSTRRSKSKKMRHFSIHEYIHNDVRCLDLIKNEWTTVEQSTTGRLNYDAADRGGRLEPIAHAPSLASHTAILFNNRLLVVFGGLKPTDEIQPPVIAEEQGPSSPRSLATCQVSRDLFVYDLLTLHWSRLQRQDNSQDMGEDGSWPSARYGHCATLVPRKSAMLLFGGIGIADSSAVLAFPPWDLMWSLDLGLMRWTPVVLEQSVPMVPRFRATIQYLPISSPSGVGFGTFILTGGVLVDSLRVDDDPSESSAQSKRCFSMRRSPCAEGGRGVAAGQQHAAPLGSFAFAIDGY